MYAGRVVPVVKRRACQTTPAATSSYLARPGRIGSPAASAEVQPSGRSALERMFQIAPEPARQPVDVLRAANSSYKKQVSRSTIRMCRSLPPSILGRLGMGYGPGSDSRGQVKRTVFFLAV